MRLEPDKIGQLVDAFLADHGGIHVGQKKLLAPGDRRLHHDIDRQVPARFAQAVSCGGDILAAVAERDVGGDFVEQPVRGPGRGQKGARAVDHRAIECGIGRMADQCGDEGHRNSRGHDNTAVLIAGPTASGKSALALALARKTGGVVINADSMQVYRDLRVLTARPPRC